MCNIVSVKGNLINKRNLLRMIAIAKYAPSLLTNFLIPSVGNLFKRSFSSILIMSSFGSNFLLLNKK